MMNDESSRHNKDEMGSMESFLEKYGEMWTEDSVSDSKALTARFRKNLSREINLEPRPSKEWGWWWNPGWIVAAAACTLAFVLVPVYWNRPVAEIVYRSGQVRVNGDPESKTTLDSSTRVETAAGGEAMISMDGGRIDLFVREGTGLDLAAIDRVTLSKGDLWVRVNPNSGHFEVETPQGRVTVHGTTFGVSVQETETRVEIASGRVSVANSRGSEFIQPGTGASLVGQQTPPAIHPSSGDVTPGWARDIFNDAAADQARRFFPSAAP